MARAKGGAQEGASTQLRCGGVAERVWLEIEVLFSTGPPGTDDSGDPILCTISQLGCPIHQHLGSYTVNTCKGTAHHVLPPPRRPTQDEYSISACWVSSLALLSRARALDDIAAALNKHSSFAAAEKHAVTALDDHLRALGRERLKFQAAPCPLLALVAVAEHSTQTHSEHCALRAPRAVFPHRFGQPRAKPRR